MFIFKFFHYFILLCTFLQSLESIWCKTHFFFSCFSLLSWNPWIYVLWRLSVWLNLRVFLFLFLFWSILMALLSILAEILGRPRIVDVFGELMILIAPLWIAVIVGVLVGWTWKPKWANLGREMMDSSVSDDSKSSSTSFSLLGSFPSFNSLNFQMPSSILSSFDGKDEKETSSMPSSSDSDSRLFS